MGNIKAPASPSEPRTQILISFLYKVESGYFAPVTGFSNQIVFVAKIMQNQIVCLICI